MRMLYLVCKYHLPDKEKGGVNGENSGGGR